MRMWQIPKFLSEPEAVFDMLWGYKVFCNFNTTVQIMNLERTNTSVSAVLRALCPQGQAGTVPLGLAWCGAPAGMKTTSPRNCTIAQPWTPYSWWRRFLSDRSKYQLWSWMGSWSTGFSWPCSSATCKVTTWHVVKYTILKIYLWYSTHMHSRATCAMCSGLRGTQWKVWVLNPDLVKGWPFFSPSGFTDTLQTWV